MYSTRPAGSSGNAASRFLNAYRRTPSAGSASDSTSAPAPPPASSSGDKPREQKEFVAAAGRALGRERLSQPGRRIGTAGQRLLHRRGLEAGPLPVVEPSAFRFLAEDLHRRLVVAEQGRGRRSRHPVFRPAVLGHGAQRLLDRVAFGEPLRQRLARPLIEAVFRFLLPHPFG